MVFFVVYLVFILSLRISNLDFYSFRNNDVEDFNVIKGVGFFSLKKMCMCAYNLLATLNFESSFDTQVLIVPNSPIPKWWKLKNSYDRKV